VALTADRNGTRWYFVGLVAVAIAISYFDRQTVSLAIAAIQRSIPISNEQFSYLQTAFLLSYACLYAIGGRMLDRVGTRRGFVLIMTAWSLACMLHGVATGFVWLLAMRFLLGMGEGGGFPAATRVIAEWLPPRERSTGMGLINGGTAIGSVLAPPLIGLILLLSGWRMVFFASGALGLLWVLWWVSVYRGNPATLSVETVDARVLARELTFREVISLRSVQTLVFAKFLSDSAWYFLLFWLPKYLYDVRGFDVKQVGSYAWIPFAASGVGSVLGGWTSSRLLQRGSSLDFARKLVLGVNAAMMPAVMLVSLVPVQYAILLFSIAFFSQQSWSALIMTIPADIFPLSVVGTVAGLIGFAGSIGGALFGLVVGALLGRGYSYGLLFVVVGTFHLIGFFIIILFGGRIQPLRPADLKEIESRA
jgi:ACS family hexuronate transporter-like MFS transporter